MINSLAGKKQQRAVSLGDTVASFRSPAPPRFRYLALAIIFFAVGTWQAYSAWQDAGGLGLMTGLLLAVVGGFAIWRWLQRRLLRIDLHDGGFVLHGIGLRRTIVWSGVSEIYQRPHFRPYTRDSYGGPDDWSYVLVKTDGRRIKLSRLSEIKVIGDYIQENLAERMMPSVMESFCEGDTIRFGQELSVNEHGLQLRHEYVAWDQVSDVTLGEGGDIRIIPVGTKNWWRRIDLAHVANPLVLIGLLRWAVSPADSDNESDEITYTPWEESNWSGEQELENVVREGYDTYEADDSLRGDYAANELLESGPVHRPRQPR